MKSFRQKNILSDHMNTHTGSFIDTENGNLEIKSKFWFQAKGHTNAACARRRFATNQTWTFTENFTLSTPTNDFIILNDIQNFRFIDQKYWNEVSNEMPESQFNVYQNFFVFQFFICWNVFLNYQFVNSICCMWRRYWLCYEDNFWIKIFLPCAILINLFDELNETSFIAGSLNCRSAQVKT